MDPRLTTSQCLDGQSAVRDSHGQAVKVNIVNTSCRSIRKLLGPGNSKRASYFFRPRQNSIDRRSGEAQTIGCRGGPECLSKVESKGDGGVHAYQLRNSIHRMIVVSSNCWAAVSLCRVSHKWGVVPVSSRKRRAKLRADILACLASAPTVSSQSI